MHIALRLSCARKNNDEDYPPVVLLILLSTSGFTCCHLVIKGFMFLIEAQGKNNRVLGKVDTNLHFLMKVLYQTDEISFDSAIR